jgi:hypothetical protein
MESQPETETETDMTKVIVGFCNFDNTHKTELEFDCMVIVYKGVKYQFKVKLQKQVSNFNCLVSLMSSEKNYNTKLTEYNEIKGKNKHYFEEIKATPTKL